MNVFTHYEMYDKNNAASSQIISSCRYILLSVVSITLISCYQSTEVETSQM